MTVPQGSPCVLIAEDEEELRELLAKVFEMEGFTVIQAGDGQEALDLFLAHQDRVDVIVTDLGLPRLGGVEMITSVRAISRTVRIIAASGFGKENVRDKVLGAGGDLFMPKPFRVGDLVDRVNGLIGRT